MDGKDVRSQVLVARCYTSIAEAYLPCGEWQVVIGASSEEEIDQRRFAEREKHSTYRATQQTHDHRGTETRRNLGYKFETLLSI
jgi:hypothetical protein